MTHTNLMENSNLVPPDGKYGWVIVLSYALANFIGIPTTSCIGLIFKEKFAEMQMPAADLTLIINVNSALSMSLGLINGPLLRAFGYRKISVIAAIVFSLGLIFTAFSDSMPSLIINYGIITAIGYGLSNSSFSLALSSFFTSNLNKASGMAMTLAGIGPIIYPPLINFLLNAYDVRGCMLIIGAIALNMLIAALLLQPLKWHLVKANPCNEMLKLNPPNLFLPNVATALSIGKFSDASINQNSTSHLPFASNDFICDRQSSRFHVDHDIDTQSIYGFDQIIRRQSSTNRLDMARNFSRRTLCSSTLPQFDKRNSMLNVEDGNSIVDEFSSNAGKPLRWFEPGSVESIHVDNSADVLQNNVNEVFLSRPMRKPSMLARSFASKHNLQTIPQKASLPLLDSKIPIEFERRISVPNHMNDLLKDHVNNLSHSMQSIEKEEQTISNCKILCQWCMSFFDLDLLRDKVYVNILIGMSISIFAEINFAILTPFILTDLNFNSDDISIILFTMAIADLVSRFCSPFIADQLNLSIRWSYVISLTLLVITRTLMVYATTQTQMLIVVVLLGIGKGIRSVYMSIVIPSYIPLDRLASASALQLFLNGIVILCFGPIAGLIKDFSGSYVGCVAFLNICSIITILMFSIELIYVKLRADKTCIDISKC